MKRSKLILTILALVFDWLAIVIGLVIAFKLRAGDESLRLWEFQKFLNYALWFTPVWLGLLASQKLYSPASLPTGWRAVGKTLIGLFAGWGIAVITLYLWRSPESQALPRLIIVYGVIATSLLLVISKILVGALISILYKLNIGVTKTVIICDKPDEKFAIELAKNKNNGRQVVSQIHFDNWRDSLEQLRENTIIDEVILNTKNFSDTELLDVILWAEQYGYSVVSVPSLLSLRSSNVEFGTLAGKPVMFFRRTPLDGWGRVYKRVLDLILVIPAIIILLPLYLIILIAIKLTSKGKAIYSQPRVGQDGRIFTIKKFRSMHENAEQKFNITWSMDESKDPRITAVGRIIRKTNLDELPQLFDVLIGKMSLVGPRPEQPKYVEQFSKEVPDYLKRHHVKSGLTGWAQVNGLRGDTSIEERVKYDLFYIENWSIWFDIRIVISTFIYVFKTLFTNKSEKNAQ